MTGIAVTSIKFYIGAATTGVGDNKWSWPGRDLRFLYEATHHHGIETSIEPDLDTWRKYGMVRWVLSNGQALATTVYQMIDSIGEAEALRLLGSCRGLYLEEGRDKTLDMLGCPR